MSFLVKRPLMLRAAWLLAVTSLLLLAGPALAEGGHAAPEAAEGAHAAEGDHWSLPQQLMPGLFHNLQGMLGNTWIEKSPVGRVAHVVMAGVVFVLLALLAVGVSKRLSDPEKAVVPETKLSATVFFEVIVGGILTMLQTSMGMSAEKARKVLPLVASLAAFILFSNVLGMIPGFLPPTDNLNTTLALGLTVFLATHWYGVRNSGLAYFKHFFGPIIAWYALPLMILMFLIEMISHVARPISLALRLMGNMFGDHKVMGIFLGFGFVLVPLPIMLLGLLVAVVQTLVFCLLTMVYFSIALEDAAHH
ncbi:MAG: hypothetical protein AMXMBFR64_60570 [Myxococcales bacterium]